MRLAFAISFGLASLVVSLARADAPFEEVDLDNGTCYIIPLEYAKVHKAEIVKSIPGEITIDGFWEITDTNVRVSERIFRELLHNAEKDPKVIFPDLSADTEASSPESISHQQQEIALVNRNYHSYVRQYVGIIVNGVKLVLCNYSDTTKADAATDYLYLEKYFVENGDVHFLQCRIDPHEQTWSNVSIIGTWQKKE